MFRRYHRSNIHLSSNGKGILQTAALVSLILMIWPETRAGTLDAIGNIVTGILDAAVAVLVAINEWAA